MSDGRSKQARLEALRLLLEHFVEESRAQKRAWYRRPQDRSVSGIRSGFAILSAEDPDSARWLFQQMRRSSLRELGEADEARLGAILERFEAWLPFPIVAPEDVIRDIRHQWFSKLHPSTEEFAYDLLAVADDEEAALDPDEGASYTDGRRAARLGDDHGGASGRFQTIGVDSARALYDEHAIHGTSGGLEPERWRTRERRRQPRAVRDPQVATRLIEGRAGKTVDSLQSCLRRGRPSFDSRQTRDVLAIAVVKCREQDNVAVAALATVLRCDPATVWRLNERGNQLIARSPGTSSEGEQPSATG